MTYQDGSFFMDKVLELVKEFEQGTGKLLIINANKKVKELVGLKCVYAINFLEVLLFTLTKCKITDIKKSIK